MSGLRGALVDYLIVRRTLGFKLAGAGLLLEQFVDFADAAHTDTITTQLAVQWATLPPGASATWHAQRLSVVRCFARWAQAFDAAIEVPPWICCRHAPGAPRRICIPMPTSPP